MTALEGDLRSGGILAAVLIAMIKCPAKTNLRKEGCILACSLRVQSILTGKTQHQAHEPLVTSHLQSGSRERWIMDAGTQLASLFGLVQDSKPWNGAAHT